MATSYSSWKNGYRLKLSVIKETTNSEARKSRVRIRAWLQSKDYGYFNGGTSREMRFNGTELMSSSSGFSVSAGGDRIIGDYSRTVDHNSAGKATVKTSAALSNPWAGSHSVALAVTLQISSQSGSVDSGSSVKPPSAPSAGPTVQVTATTVKMTSATAKANGDPIAQYEIRRRNNRSGSYGGWTSQIVPASARSFSYGLIKIDKAYQFQSQSRAVNSAGWGPWSDTRTTTIAAKPPSGDIDGIAVDLALGQVTASWDTPDGGASEYEVALEAGGVWGAAVSTGTTRTRTFTGLTPGTYRVRARARNSTGWKAWATSDLETLGTLPGTPTALAFDDEGTATWTPPASTGGIPIDDYDAEWWIRGAWQAGGTDDLSSARAMYLPGVGYMVRVRAVNDLGAGSWATSGWYVGDECPCGE